MCTSILWNIIYTVIVLHGMCSVAALQSFCHRSVLYYNGFSSILRWPTITCRLLDCDFTIYSIYSPIFLFSRHTDFLVFWNYRFLPDEGRGVGGGWERWPRQCEKYIIARGPEKYSSWIIMHSELNRTSAISMSFRLKN